MFQIPAPTRLDLRFTLFGVPVRVHPLFWLMGVIFGAGTGDATKLFIWIAVVFVSILIHEFGHSVAMRVFGMDSYIVLYIFGGLAVPTSPRRGSSRVELSRGWLEQVIISLAGPFAGFLLVTIAMVAVKATGGLVVRGTLFQFIPVPIALVGDPMVNYVLEVLVFINIFWGLINLMPVFPLDGGQAARAIFVRVSPWNGLTNSLWLSILAGVIVAVGAFAFLRSTYMAFLFGILAVQSYQMLKFGGGRTF